SENPAAAKEKIREQLQNDAERDAILDKLREKILAGNQAAKDLVKDLAANATKPDLQNKAKQLLADIEKQLAADGGDPKNDPTNFLPNNTQVVLFVPIAKLLNTNLGGQAFFVEGAFRMEDFNNHLGIELNKIQQYVLGADRRHGSSILAVVRTTEAFSW